jgi:hypothetical protein
MTAQLNLTLVAVTTPKVGAGGAVKPAGSVVAETVPEGTLLPVALLATTRNEYAVDAARPVTVADVAAAAVVLVNVVNPLLLYCTE